jgi:hypothetical protein
MQFISGGDLIIQAGGCSVDSTGGQMIIVGAAPTGPSAPSARLEIYDSRDDDGGMYDAMTDEYREGRIFDDVDLIS